MNITDYLKENKMDFKTNKLKNLTLFLIKFLFLSFVFFTLLFGRPVVGLSIFQYRIGELTILFGLLVSVIILFTPKKYFVRFFDNTEYLFLYKLIILSFLVIALISQSSFSDTYTFRISSYIWSLGFFVLGIISIFSFRVEFINPLMLFLVIPFFTYIMSTGNYPNFIMKFLKENADKFQFLKPSDIFLGYIVVNFMTRYILKNKDSRVIYLIISSALLAPLLLAASRGSFLGILLFFILEIYTNKNYIKNNWKKFSLYLFIGLIVLIFSTSRIDFENKKGLNLGDEFIDYLSENSNPAGLINSLREFENKKDTVRVFFSFYWHYGRLESTDSTTNWRLDIWQDVIYGVIEEGKVLTGYGYKEIFPQMTDPSAPGRLGRDGMNEHVHNYFVNIFARGGIGQLILFVLLHLSFIKYWVKKNGNYEILNFIIPCILVSSLDVTMEGVQFPLIYYSFLYYFLNMNVGVKK